MSASVYAHLEQITPSLVAHAVASLALKSSPESAAFLASLDAHNATLQKELAEKDQKQTSTPSVAQQVAQLLATATSALTGSDALSPRAQQIV